jgi:hypothetical protein
MNYSSIEKSKFGKEFEIKRQFSRKLDVLTLSSNSIQIFYKKDLKCLKENIEEAQLKVPKP